MRKKRRAKTGGAISTSEILDTITNRKTLYVSAEALLETLNLNTKEQARYLGGHCRYIASKKYPWVRDLSRVVHIDIDNCTITSEFAFVLSAFLKFARVKYRFLAQNINLSDWIRLVQAQKLANEVYKPSTKEEGLTVELIRECTKKRMVDMNKVYKGKQRDMLITRIRGDIREALGYNRYGLVNKDKEGMLNDCLRDIRNEFQEYLK